MARHNLPINLCLYLHGFVRCAGANFVKVKRHILCEDLGNKNRSRWWFGGFNLGNTVLVDSIEYKGSEHDEQRIGVAGNIMAFSTIASHLIFFRPVQDALFLEIEYGW